MIKIENISYKYESKIKALENVTLEIKEGDLIAISGHQSAGKTTLAYHLNGLLIPNSGDVWIDKLNTKDKSKIYSIRQKVGLVFTNPENQLIGTTVEEDIAFGLENLKIKSSDIQTKVDKILKFINMEDYKKSSPHLLSAGQKQLVAIAGVVVLEPKYLILDDVTSLLDSVNRRKIIEYVLELNRTLGITVVFITHSIEDAMKFNRIIFLKQGKIVLDTTPTQIINQPHLLQELNLEIPVIAKVTTLFKEIGLQLPVESIIERFN
ncbi:MAG: ATP-binding cassette domain-containing protein [bacterium]